MCIYIHTRMCMCVHTHMKFGNQCAYNTGLPSWLSGKESASQFRRREFDPWVGKMLWRRKWLPTPVFLPEEPHGQRSLVGCSPWGCKELSTKHHQQNNNAYKVVVISPSRIVLSSRGTIKYTKNSDLPLDWFHCLNEYGDQRIESLVVPGILGVEIIETQRKGTC